MIFEPDVLTTKAKLGALGLVGAVLAILQDPPQSNYQRAVAIICGVIIAAIVTPPVVERIGLSQTWEAAVAAGFGIAGRGLVGWLMRASQNPISAARELIGISKDRGGGK